jgi:predicted nucleic acid-binding protein
MKIFFADTFYFVALLNQRDQHHEKAKQFRRGLTERLLTTELILIEVADRVAGGRGRRLIAGLFNDLRQSNDCEVIPSSEALEQGALDLYHKHSDKDWTLTDCTSFVIMRERGISEALTGDRHFKQAGFIAMLK